MSKSDNLQTKLKKLYSCQDSIPKLIEGEEKVAGKKVTEQSLSEYYVKLQMIVDKAEGEEEKVAAYDKVVGEKRAIEVADIFNKIDDQHPAVGKILLLGAAGVGKTTLLHYMSYYWGKGRWDKNNQKVFDDKFEYLFRVRLKTLLNENWSKEYTYEQKDENLLACFIHRCLKLQISDLESTKKINKGEIKITLKEVVNSLDAKENNSKILLLLDGYDEMSSLENSVDRRDEYRDIIDSIFEYQNVVMTSRPNAINDAMQVRFERQIVNEGLDLAGVRQYVELNFREDNQQVKLGENLENFLSTNSNVLDMCKIPINTALLCLIWHDQQVRDKLTSGVEGDQCNTGLLYREVILWLGRRYSKKFDEEFAKRKLSELSDEAILTSPMLDILRDVAYTGFNKGKVKIDGETFKTGELAIAGKIVDHLRLQKLQQPNNKLTISDITKYGLLRAEGDIDQPIKQNYYFIHLTFQEYLTACYLKDHLASSDQKTAAKMASLIANHRNDPKYLMTLKFLSGLVTSEQGENSQELVTRFWEAVTCNIDGVIELGIEAKINLLMHLLGQAKVKGEIDNRIPNREQILQLIDTIILGNLSVWGNQIKDSNYINDNIKQRLLKEIIDKNNAVTGRYIEIVSDLINKFSLKEQEEIITRLQDIILKETAVETDSTFNELTSIDSTSTDSTTSSTNSNNSKQGEKDWQLTKQAIDGITKIATQVKLAKTNVEGLIEVLVSKIKDVNYRQAAVKSIYELLNNIKDQELWVKTIQQFKELLLDKNSGVRVEIARKIIELVEGIENKELVKRLIVEISRHLADGSNSVREIVAQEAIELLNNLENMELATEIIDTFSPLWKAEVRDDRVIGVQGSIENLPENGVEDQELIKNLIVKMGELLADGSSSVREIVAQEAIELVSSLNDMELAKKLKVKIIRLFVDGNSASIKEAITLYAIDRVNSIEDQQGLVKSLEDEFNELELLKSIEPKELVGTLIVKVGKFELPLKSMEIKKLVKKLIDKIEGLRVNGSSEVREQVIPLADEDSTVEAEKLNLIELVEDTNLISSLTDEFSKFFVEEDERVKQAGQQEARELLKSIKGEQLIKYLIRGFPELLADESSSVVEPVVNIEDKKVLTQQLIDDLKKHLDDENSGTRERVAREASKFRTEDKVLAKKLTDELSIILGDQNLGVVIAAGNSIAEIAASLQLSTEELKKYLNHSDLELRKKVVAALVKSFKDLLAKFELLKELIKDEQNLKIEIIEKKLLNNNLDKNLQKQVLENLNKLLSSEDKVTKDKIIIDIKDKILSRLHKIGNVKSHELIEIALSVIGNDDISADDTSKKELVQLARDVINRQIEYLSSEGLKWINDNFEDLVKISKDSKLFVRKLYHKILADLVSDKEADVIILAKELIIKSINYGMTTSLSKTGEIIFEGKKYILKGDNKDVILEEIARAIIDQDLDILARQYREHDPLFPRTGVELEKAAADVSAKSIIDNTVELSHSIWRLSLMHLSDHKKHQPSKEFALLEQRDAFGYHTVHKIYVEAGKICCESWKEHPNKISTDFRKKIFGEMEYTETKPIYYCSISNEIPLEKGKELIQKLSKSRGEISDDIKLWIWSFFNDDVKLQWENGISWDEYKYLPTTRGFKKVQLLHIQDEGKIALIRQESSDISAKERMEELMEKLDISIGILSSKLGKHDSVVNDLSSKFWKLKEDENVTITALEDLYQEIEVIKERLSNKNNDQSEVNMLTGIIYDNQLLNHIELLQESIKIYGFDNTVNMSKCLSEDLVKEAIEKKDGYLILAGLVSLDDDYLSTTN